MLLLIDTKRKDFQLRWTFIRRSVPLAFATIASAGTYLYNNVLAVQAVQSMTGVPNIARALGLLDDIMKATKIAATLEFLVVTTVS